MFENDHERQELLKAIRAGYVRPERSREYWGEDEREKLNLLFYAGVDISQIALLLQRSEQAVVQQLIAGNQMTAPGTSRVRGPKPVRCLCEKCQLWGDLNACPLYKEGPHAGEL